MCESQVGRDRVCDKLNTSEIRFQATRLNGGHLNNKCTPSLDYVFSLFVSANKGTAKEPKALLNNLIGCYLESLPESLLES